MKFIKKAMCVLLAAMLVFAMGITASADQPTGTITISSAQWNQTYNIYRIFDLEANDDFSAFSYTVSDKWADFFISGTGALDYVTIDSTGYVKWSDSKTDSDAAEFAQLALDFALTNGIASDGTKNTGAKPEGGANTTTAVFTGLPYGYYLVESTLGALCAIDTTTPSVTINEKNEIPEIEKEVFESSASQWGDENDASIGDTVNFRSTITVKAGAENYIMHDDMSDGLTFDPDSVTVSVNSTEVADTNYTVVTSPNDSCTFEVQFNNSYVQSLAADTEIVVAYNAVLNEDAVIAGSGNKNSVKLSYGENSSNTTVPSETVTYAWEFSVLKYTVKNDEALPLSGAVFALYTDKECKNTVNLVDITVQGGVPTYQVCTKGDTEHDHITTITTDADGKFSIVGLDSDSYYLKELKAPEGYNLLASPITVDIDNDGEVSANNTVLTDKTVKVENKTGIELPSTGGMGTTIFTAVGAVLMLGAAIVLISKKKASAYKE